MKLPILIGLALAGWLNAAGLAFQESVKDVKLGVEDKTITMDFPFTNSSEKPVTITKSDGGCSCMSVQISGGKMNYAPGESGVVRANFDVGNFSGMTVKHVSLWLAGDPADKPSVLLTANIHIPVLIETEPKTVKWTTDGKADPQTIRIHMNHDKPIKILNVNMSSEAYKQELKTIEEGKDYELVITPVDVKSPGLAVIRLETDCEVSRHKIQQVFAVTQKTPVPAALAKP